MNKFKPKKIIHIVGGARPNFIKIAPLLKILDEHKDFIVRFIHTGQHYDFNLSTIIFKDLDLRNPDFFLNINSESDSKQIAKIMLRYEKVILKKLPDLVIVFGDVNSTIASALTAKKYGLKIMHVESGLRSFDESMPEEINRKVTDSISDILLTPSRDADQNLIKENICKKKIFNVGNIMIDSLVMCKRKNKKAFNLKRKERSIILTLHRPENVDDQKQFSSIIDLIQDLQSDYKIIFPVHPRAKKNLEKFNLFKRLKNLRNVDLLKPLGYTDFLVTLNSSTFVITDSGGVQEESTFLRVPCFTLRKNTERPITIKEGTNCLVNLDNVRNKIKNSNIRKLDKPRVHRWDGKTSQRIVKIIKNFL
tara:strand:- start:28986 stop:30077 length:1092 start_codon:yes stop_codon:yes gene_type:complete